MRAASGSGSATPASLLAVIGCREDALTELAQQELGVARLEQDGATGVVGAVYRLDYSLTAPDVAA